MFNRKSKSILEKLKRSGKRVISLKGGNLPVYGHINELATDNLVQAAKEGWGMYPSTTSWANKLRNAISNFEKRFRHVSYATEDIILSHGVAGCFRMIHDSLLDPGDEICTIEPAHYLSGPSSYLFAFKSKVLASPSDEEKNWKPDLEKLRANITERTKAVVIVHPNNPTGAVYSEKDVKAVIDIAGEHGIPIISDEIYGLITFDGIECKPVALLAKDVPIIALSSTSKFIMKPGWCVGYACFHDPEDKIAEVEKIMKKVAGIYGRGAMRIPTPILVAATKTYEGSMSPGKEMIRKVQRGRDFTWKRLNEIEGISCTKPQGTLYAFPCVHHIGEGERWRTDVDFVLEILKEEGILFFPGSQYGKSGFRHFRTLLFPEITMLKEAYNKLERFLEQKK